MLYDRIEFPDNAPLRFCIIEVDEYPFHMHEDVLEIIFALEGTLELDVVNNVLQLRAGDIYICSPNELHRLCACGGTRGIVMLIHLNLEVYKPEFPDISTYQFANSALEKNRTGIQILGNYLKKQIPKLLDRNERGWTDFKEIGDKILRILIKEFQCYYLGNFFPEFNPAYKDNELQLKRIRRIIDYIYLNYNKPIMIKDVADMEHISTYHLTYILKNGCGMGFRMFLNMARVEQSAAKLLGTGMGLQAIAYESGFSKYKYFSESFEKVFRMTPQEYRQRYQDRTILVRKRRVRELEGAELEALIRKFCSKSEEIKLDLNVTYPAKRFRKPRCIHLPGLQYDHITGLPMLKQLKSELDFDQVGIDMAFLRRYKNNLKALGYMLSDFLGLRAGIRICLAGGESLLGLRGYLEFFSAQCDPAEGKLVFLIAMEGEEERAQAAELKHFISTYGFAASIVERSAAVECNPIHASGYMPCFMLHAMFQGESLHADQITLTDELGPAGGGLALMTAAGLKTPVYHLLYLLARMDDSIIEEGEMYFVTQKEGKADFQVLIYYYDECFDALFQDASKAAEHATFMDLVAKDCDSNREVALQINHISGNYAMRRYRLTSEDYQSKYRETPFLSYGGLSEETVGVLNATLAPETTLSMLEATGTYSVDCKLGPFEILLLSFEKL